eukprot:874455-Ditylum_brightwellii.AAC.1
MSLHSPCNPMSINGKACFPSQIRPFLVALDMLGIPLNLKLAESILDLELYIKISIEGEIGIEDRADIVPFDSRYYCFVVTERHPQVCV